MGGETQMIAKCPTCGTEKEIDGTETRVRCANKEDCGKRFYVKGNIVPEKGDRKDNNRTSKNRDALDSMVHALYPMVKDVSLGRDINKSAIVEGLNNTIRIYRNSKINKEGSRVKKNDPEGKKVLEWVELHESQRPIPLLVAHHPYFLKVLDAYRELEKLRG